MDRIFFHWNQTKFPIIQSMVAKRGLTNRSNVHNPMWEKTLKTQQGIISIDPATLIQQSIQQSKQKRKRKLKMPTRWSEATRAETRNRIPFVGP